MDDFSMYVCPKCKKTFKVKGNNKKVKCPQCAKDLLDMNISLDSWDALGKEGRDKFKEKNCNSMIKEPEQVVEEAELFIEEPPRPIEKKSSFFDTLEEKNPIVTPVNTLFECPKCKNKIPTGSKFCPECGYDFASKTKNTATPNIKNKNQDSDIGKNKKKWLIPVIIGSITLVLAAVVLVIILTVSSKSKPSKEAMRLIDSIGEVSKDSEAAILEAEDYYSTLTEGQKDAVDNYKVLVDARKKYDEICAEEQAEARIQEINRMIASMASAKVKQQSKIDEIMELYDSLPDDKKSAVSKNINTLSDLTEYEKVAVVAVNALRSSLKDSGSLVVHSISVGKGTSKALSPFYVKIDYSANNSFGGTKDEIATIDVTSKMAAGWWKMARTFGDNGYTELQVYNDYLNNSTDKTDLDPDRIMKNL